MAEATGGDGAQGAPAPEAQGASDTSPQGGAPQTEQGSSGEQGTASVEALTRKVAELERDNRAYRKREKDREDADRTKAESEMSEVERLRAENERLKSDLSDRDTKDRARSLQVASLAAATRLGFRNPEAATKLLRADDPDIVWKDGEPSNVEALLTEWAKANTYAVASTDFGGGQRGQSATSGAPNMNDLIRGAAAAKR